MMTQSSKNGKLKVAVLCLKEETHWVSCQAITANLISSYITLAETKVFKLYGDYTVFETIDQIIEARVNVISIVDHRLRLLDLFRSEKLVKFIRENKVKVLVHVFGCYPDRLMEYHGLGQILSGLDLVFLAASIKHLGMVNKTLISPETALVPFPVAMESFSFDAERRKVMREKLSVSEDTSLFIYTGRISQLKNVELSMKLLNKIRNKGKKLKFLYVGTFDAFEPVTGQTYYGHSAQINARVLNQVDPNREWCFHRSFVPANEVADYLSAADAFISLSTFRGEDFGMSIAEAKCSGLPCFVTDWAGLSGFKSLPETYTAKVTIAEKDLSIDLSEFEKQIEKFVPLREADRKLIAQKTQAEFSVAAVSRKLELVLNAKSVAFGGVKSKFPLFRDAFPANGLAVILGLRELYEEYAN